MIIREAECVWATLAKVNPNATYLSSILKSFLSFFYYLHIKSMQYMTIVMKTILCYFQFISKN